MVPSTHQKDTPVTTSEIDAHHTSGARLSSRCGYQISPLRCPADSWALMKGRPPFFTESKRPGA
ncbi:hypothetical protein YC2023_039873 [Brassica napus]